MTLKYEICPLHSDLFFGLVDSIIGNQMPGKTIGWGRWRRGAGGGRYKNVGLIRYYSPTNIHVLFHTPPLNKVFVTEADALSELKELFKT